jgi:Ca-activated chloride channel family protein
MPARIRSAQSGCCVAVMFLFSTAPARASDPAPQDQPKVSVTPRTPLGPRPENSPARMRMDMNLVLVPVTVTDASDRPVSGLALDTFRLFEDNVEQKIVTFFREEGPVSVGFLFDSSGSMKKKMDRSVAAIEQFLKTITQGDEFFLMRFSDQPVLLTGFTSDPKEILSELSVLQPQGWTALNDAICLGLQRMKSAKNPRRALFVLSDGGDNNSRYSDAEVRGRVRESDIRVYSIGLFERPRFLEKLAADSGGRSYWVHKLEELPGEVEQLSRDLRNQYVLGYSSLKGQQDGKYHALRVELMETIKRMPLHLFWRRGYYAPGE